MSTTHPDQNQHALQTYLQQRQDPAWYLDVNDPELKNISGALADSMDRADIDTLLQLASAYIDAGQEKKIITLCEHKYEQDENIKDLLSRIAYQESVRGNDEIATKLYRLDLKRDRTSSTYKSLLALEEAKSGNWQVAEQLANDACKESQDPWGRAGPSYLGLKKLIDSKDINYAKSKLTIPSPSKIRLEAMITLIEKDPERTIKFIEKSYRANPNAYGVFDFVGWYLVWSGEIETGNQFMNHERSFQRKPVSWLQNHILTLGIIGQNSLALTLLNTMQLHDNKQIRIGCQFYKPKITNKKNLENLLDNNDTNALIQLIR